MVLFWRFDVVIPGDVAELGITIGTLRAALDLLIVSAGVEGDCVLISKQTGLIPITMENVSG